VAGIQAELSEGTFWFPYLITLKTLFYFILFTF